MTPLLSAPLRVLELSPEPHGRAWRLTVTQHDGKDRREVAGFDLTPDELALLLASVRAIAAYATGANWEAA